MMMLTLACSCVLRLKTIGQLSYGHMSSGKCPSGIWANVFMGKRCKGKCHHGQTSFEQMSKVKCRLSRVVWANDI
jgi:hypothetical protein